MQRDLLALTWEQFDHAVEHLAMIIRNCTPPHAPIYGEPRGGLILAVTLSHATGRPFTMQPQDGMVWIDDIIDSGKMRLAMLEKFTPAAALCWVRINPRAEFSDYVASADATDWIVFPWESIKNAEADRDAYLSNQ